MPPTAPLGPTDPEDPADPAAPPAPSPTPNRARRTSRDGRGRRRHRSDGREWSAPRITAVVFAVASLTGFAGTGLVSALDRPGRGDAAARWHLRRLVDEIARYRREVGPLPPSLEALGLGEALADRGAPAGGGAPRGRGLNLGPDGVPLDPWGGPYDYTVLDEGRGAYELRSAAEDHVVGTADDVVVRLP